MTASELPAGFEALMDSLKHDYHCDLYGYKLSTLQRHFNHRMGSLQIESYQDYLSYLRSHPEEPQALLNDLFINYTYFFRDADFWHYLATQVVPQIITYQQPGEMIRIWSAGCAKGQEICSILILLAETMGIDTCLEQVKCFATDIDKDVLQKAKRGIYTSQELENLPANLLEKYFEATAKGCIFHPKLHRRIVFGHHDLIRDPPISKIDLLLCRNVLIYFTTDIQKSILNRFHFALKKTGFLVLGRSEAIVDHKLNYKAVDWQQRVYAKDASLTLQDLLTILPKFPQQ